MIDVSILLQMICFLFIIGLLCKKIEVWERSGAEVLYWCNLVRSWEGECCTVVACAKEVKAKSWRPPKH